MPWKEASTMSLKEEFVLLANQEGANVRQLCCRFGISPKTAYKWLDRFRQEGNVGLANRSRRPDHSPASHYSRCGSISAPRERASPCMGWS